MSAFSKGAAIVLRQKLDEKRRGARVSQCIFSSEWTHPGNLLLVGTDMFTTCSIKALVKYNFENIHLKEDTNTGNMIGHELERDSGVVHLASATFFPVFHSYVELSTKQKKEA